MVMNIKFYFILLVFIVTCFAAEKNTYATVDSLTGRAEVQRAGTQA